MRVLHILSKLDAGGIEKWLLDLSRNDDKHQHYVLCISGEEGCWHSEFERVFTYPNIKSGKLKFLSNFRGFLKDNKFDIIHSHLYRFSAVISLSLFGLNKKVICHSHNDKRVLYKNVNKFSPIFINGILSRFLFKATRTTNIAASSDAGDDLFGHQKFTVIRCGLSFNKQCNFISKDFNESFNKDKVKIVTIGSLTRQKNHEFLIRTLAHEDLENFELDIIGEGELRGKLEKVINELGLQERVKLLGVLNNPMDKIFSYDKFIFPSIYEGLGLALIEAQASGIPCIISDTIPLDADIVSGNIKRVSLKDEKSWRDSLINFQSTVSPLDSMKLVLSSDFNIENSIKALDECYGKL
ncbi:glycosyltransferase [Vibrio parahaemolyticus]|nr:glycosyltransferase [Vibrio parahaemolyticus]